MSSISEIFDKDPLSYTKEDIEDVISYYRKMRLQFKLGDKKAGATARIPGPEKGTQDLKSLDLDL